MRRDSLSRSRATASRLTLVWLGAVLGGCPGEPAPDRVRVELAEVVTNRDALRPVVRAHRGNSSANVAPGAYALRAEPAGVAVANPDGTVSCAKSGDARLTADVKGVSGTGVLRCRLVDRVDVTELPVLELEKGTVPLVARALDKSGAELSDVPISVTSTNQAPLRAKGLELTPLAVGTTDLVVRAGGAVHKFSTQVVRSVPVTPKPLYGGKRLDIELAPGKYAIEVRLREPKELRVDWRGVRQCAYRATAALHRSTCTLAQKGFVTLDNPLFVEAGETTLASDRVSVREVP